MKKLLLLSIFLYCFLSWIFAGSLNSGSCFPKISGDTSELKVTPMAGLIDSTGNKVFSKIETATFTIPYQEIFKSITASNKPYTYWIRFGIDNVSSRKVLLHIYSGLIDYTDLYFVSQGHIITALKGGVLRPYPPNIPQEDQIEGTLPLTLNPQQHGTLFIGLKQRTVEKYFDGIRIFSQSAFYPHIVNDIVNSNYFTVFQILFQGFLLCQLLYVLFQWITIKRKEYLYYLLYLLIIAVYFLSKYESVYGIGILFTYHPILKVYLGKTLLIIPYFLYFRFIRSFLDIPSNYKTLNKWMTGLEVFLLIYTGIDLIFIIVTFNQRLQGEVFTFVILLIFILTTVFIVYLFKKRQPLLFYVLTGSLFVAVGNILGLVFTYISDYTTIPLGFHNMLIFSQIGIILEIACFTAGLGYKSHTAEKEKIQSQKKLIEQLKANEELHSKMLTIRNRIAQDLHDDIGSTLSSISIMSDLIQKDATGPRSSEMLSEIKYSSRTLMEKIDDIIWSINPRNDSIEHLLLRIKRIASTLFEARNIDYQISIQQNIGLLKFSMEERQHIYLILKESINNLVKYSEATQAWITIGFDQSIFEIRIKDNGIGFDLTDYSDGNGILSMKNRALDLHADFDLLTKTGSGTEVILKLKIK